jgi:hypothetical protein
MIKLRNILNEGGLLQDYEDIVGKDWLDFKKNYKKLNKDYTIKHHQGLYFGYAKGTRVAHWKYDDDQGRLYIDDKMVARKIFKGRADKNIFEGKVKHIDMTFTDRGRYYKTKFDGKNVSRSDAETTLKTLLGYDVNYNIADDDKLDKMIKDLKKKKIKFTWSDNIDVS